MPAASVFILSESNAIDLSQCAELHGAVETAGLPVVAIDAWSRRTPIFSSLSFDVVVTSSHDALAA